MATLAIAAGGAVAGGVVGGLVPGVGVLLGVQLGFLGGAILGNILFPTEVDAGGPSRDDVRLSSAATGRFIPIPYGVNRVGGQYIWVGEPVFKTKTSSVGKGGGAEVKETTMLLSWICGICEGPITAVTRIWLDGDLVWDISENNPDGPALSDALLASMLLKESSLPPSTSFEDSVQTIQVQALGPIRVYLGGEDAPVEPMLQNDPRIGEAFGGQTPDFVPPFHGLAYAAFDQIPGEAANNHFPQVEFEVLKGGTNVYNASEYEPCPSRTRNNRLGDMITFVGATQLTDPIYRWNVIDKNPDDPESWHFNPITGLSTDDVIMPQNVGPWRDPLLRCLAFGGTGDSRWSSHDMATGVEVAPRKILAVAGVQPIGGWFYPNTLFPTRFIGVAETTDQIFSFPLSWTNDIGNLNEIANIVSDPPVPGTGIATASFQIKPGFVGPDGLLYITTGETNSSHQAIIAIDPYTLDIQRSLEPYKASPPQDDPFWSDMMLTYDEVTDKIIIGTTAQGGWLRRVDRKTLTVDPIDDIGPGAFGSDNYQAMKNGPSFGTIWLQTGGGNVHRDFDLWNMAPGPCGPITGTSDYGVSELENEAPVYDPINGGIWVQAFYNTDWLAFLPTCRQGPACTTAAAIAQDISDRCEMPSSLRDTAGWAGDSICGYLIGRRISGRKALEPIAGAINGDFRTQDGKVQFFKLDSGSVKTIPEDDLGAAETIDAKVPGRDIRWPYERELPARVDVQYVDRAMDYSSNTQGFDRPLDGFRGRGKETVQMPIVFDADADPTPIEIAERLLYAFDANKQNHALALSWAHLDLNVGDAIDYTRGDFTHTVRIEKWALGENNKILIEAKSEDISINTASGQAASGVSAIFSPPTLRGPISSQLFLIDLPLLRDQDDANTGIPIYAAAAPTGIGADWSGARLLRSDDGGITWQIVDTFTSGDAVAWGRAASALGGTNRPHAIDRSNSLTVNMVKGVLPGSVANADLDEDRKLNALLVGDGGRWEVVRYATAVSAAGSPDTEGDTYTVSELRRGQRGTNQNVGTHRTGDFVIVLEENKLRRLVLDQTDLNVERLYKVVTIGQPENLAPPIAFTLAGESKKPYSMVHVTGSRNPATGAWMTTATRRTRVGGGWVDFVEPPLGEESEEYEVEVLDAPGGSVIAAKTGLSTPSATFTGEELGFSPGTDSPFTLTVSWYQISATVGRGNSEDVTLSAPTPGFP